MNCKGVMYQGKRFPSIKSLSQEIGYSRKTIYQWLNKGLVEYIPEGDTSDLGLHLGNTSTGLHLGNTSTISSKTTLNEDDILSMTPEELELYISGK